MLWKQSDIAASLFCRFGQAMTEVMAQYPGFRIDERFRRNRLPED